MARQNDLLMDISILYRSTQKYYDKKLANLSLTYAQLPILIAIYEEEGISMQKIALDGGYDKGTITKNVQKLVNLGYVIVQSSIKDKRAKELYTTDKTKEVMNQIYKVIWSRVKHCYVVVSEIAGRCGKMGDQLLKRRACPSARFCAPLPSRDACCRAWRAPRFMVGSVLQRLQRTASLSGMMPRQQRNIRSLSAADPGQ